MLSTARRRGLERAITSTPSTSLPSFLLPAFHIPRSFSTSPQCSSQIGRAPLSIPPEVNFSIIPPPLPKKGKVTTVPGRPTVHIEGPLGMNWKTDTGKKRRLTNNYAFFLGKMTMTIPQNVNLEHDEALRKAFVSINDREVREQREMWGTSPTSTSQLSPPFKT